MNKTETLQAAEIMRRAAEGEMVECRHRSYADSPWSRADVGFGVGQYNCPCWNWENWEWRVLDFPSPPPNTQWHNPANLNATQVGVHEGWRLLLESEYSGWVKDVEGWNPVLLKWFAMQAVNLNLRTSTIMRVKSPLPEVKADPMEKAWEKFQHNGFPYLRDSFEFAWQACKEHYKIKD